MHSLRALFPYHDQEHTPSIDRASAQDTHSIKKSATVREPATHLPEIDVAEKMAKDDLHITKTPFPIKSASTSGKSTKGTSLTSIREVSEGSNRVETTMRRINDEISELEDQSVNIFTEVKKIGYIVSIMNARQNELICKLERIEELLQNSSIK